jgi:hypothetical protein
MLGEGLDVDGFVQELKNNVFRIHNSKLSEWIEEILGMTLKRCNLKYVSFCLYFSFY